MRSRSPSAALAKIIAPGSLTQGGRRRTGTFDFLGYGQSGKPADHAYSTKGLEGDLSAVVSGLGLHRIVPVAHDASGPTAINWALDHMQQVAGLVVLNTYYSVSPTLKFPEFISLFADPAYRNLSAAMISYGISLPQRRARPPRSWRSPAICMPPWKKMHNACASFRASGRQSLWFGAPAIPT